MLQDVFLDGLKELLALLVWAFVPWLVYKAGKLLQAGIDAVQAWLAEKKDVAWAEVAEALIMWVELKMNSVSGEERMMWVLGELKRRGWEIDVQKAEWIFQQLKQADALPNPKPAAPKEAA
jgi:hypothetical protein